LKVTNIETHYILYKNVSFGESLSLGFWEKQCGPYWKTFAYPFSSVWYSHFELLLKGLLS